MTKLSISHIITSWILKESLTFYIDFQNVISLYHSSFDHKILKYKRFCNQLDFFFLRRVHKAVQVLPDKQVFQVLRERQETLADLVLQDLLASLELRALKARKENEAVKENKAHKA